MVGKWLVQVLDQALRALDLNVFIFVGHYDLVDIVLEFELKYLLTTCRWAMIMTGRRGMGMFWIEYR